MGPVPGKAPSTAPPRNPNWWQTTIAWSKINDTTLWSSQLGRILQAVLQQLIEFLHVSFCNFGPGPRCWWSSCCRWCPIVQSAAIPAGQRKEFLPPSEQACTKRSKIIQDSYFQILLSWNFQVEHSSTAWFHPEWSAHDKINVLISAMVFKWL